jgi:hypothetical protein
MDLSPAWLCAPKLHGLSTAKSWLASPRPTCHSTRISARQKSCADHVSIPTFCPALKRNCSAGSVQLLERSRATGSSERR